MKAFTKPDCLDCAQCVCDECERIDVFTTEEVERAKRIIKASMDELQKTNRIMDEVITEDVMQRIDRETGQVNFRRYMAYRIQKIVVDIR